jgi:hypothetical protein
MRTRTHTRWEDKPKWGAAQKAPGSFEDNKLDCMKQVLSEVPEAKYGAVMADTYRRMCVSVHQSLTAMPVPCPY